jgi:hypothetical protein
LLTTIPGENFIYAGPDSGFAQVALAYTTLLLGKSANVFVNTAGDQKDNPPPLVVQALCLKANIRPSPTYKHGRSLKKTQAAALEYAEQDAFTRILLPFGLKFPPGHEYFNLFREAIIEALPAPYRPDIENTGVFCTSPRRLWIVAGSGFIFDVLHSVWPNTKLMIVQVGKKIYPDQLNGIDAELFVAPQDFCESALSQPPYPTVPWYDAKIWQFFQVCLFVCIDVLKIHLIRFSTFRFIVKMVMLFGMLLHLKQI